MEQEKGGFEMRKEIVNKSIILGLAVFMVVSLCVFAYNSPAYAGPKKTITIGLMSCISGPQAVIGNTCKYGAEQAVDYVNKEQLLGSDIQLKLIVVELKFLFTGLTRNMELQVTGSKGCTRF